MLGGPAGTAVAEFAAVGQRNLLEQGAGFARAQRGHDHGEHITLLDHVELPADAIEDARVGAFDGPLGLLAILAGSHEVDVDMRVLPVEFLHLASQLDLVVTVEHGEGMVRKRSARECAGKQRN